MELDAVRQQRRRDPLELFPHGAGDPHRVGSLLLGNRDGDRGLELVGHSRVTVILARALSEGGQRLHLRGSEFDGGDVAEIDRLALAYSDDQIGDLLVTLQRDTGFDDRRFIQLVEAAGGNRHVRAAQGARDVRQRQAAAAQTLGIDLHPHLEGSASHDARRPGVAHRLESQLDLLGDSAQLDVGVRGARERDIDDRHIVDLDGLDHPTAHAGRGQIGVHGQRVCSLTRLSSRSSPT